MVRRNDEPEDKGYIPDEDDPDYELSEVAGYTGWEQPKRQWLRPLLLGISLLILASLLAPMILVVLR